jgi:hypothetical protein
MESRLQSPTMVGSRDVFISMVLALVIIVIVISHKWRLSPRDLEGYWRVTRDGDHIGREYQISADPHSENGIQITGRSGPKGPLLSFRGAVKFLRKVCVWDLQNTDGSTLTCGSVDLQGRHLDWGGGIRWVREGVYNCSSCI